MQKIFGIIFILVAFGIVSGYDKKIQIGILDSGFLDVTKIEQRLLDKKDQQDMIVSKDTAVAENLEPVQTTDMKNEIFLTEKEKGKKFILAPDISSPDGFINTNGLPITINEFKGKKVVLLDIWTYSCINCQRTLPYLNKWDKEYEDDGLVIIGLHTPEFAFEKVQKNVEKAVKDFNITYPVVFDNDFSTWREYKNQYWPRKYLIDIDGYIVYDHAGEGQYSETEIAIQKALRERAQRLEINMNISSSVSSPTNTVIVEPSKVNSPEIYFGSARNERLSNGQPGISGTQTLTFPKTLRPNELYLEGTWDFSAEYTESKSPASIVFNYDAKNVYMAAGSDTGVEIEVYKDDVFVKKIMVKDEQLYPLLTDTDYGKHKLTIKIPKAGLKAFTFTFG
jgi:thiol-disulfide isomerase/thioredoxin